MADTYTETHGVSLLHCHLHCSWRQWVSPSSSDQCLSQKHWQKPQYAWNYDNSLSFQRSDCQAPWIIGRGIANWSHGTQKCSGRHLQRQWRACPHYYSSEPLPVHILRHSCPVPRQWQAPFCRFCLAPPRLDWSSLQPLPRHPPHPPNCRYVPVNRNYKNERSWSPHNEQTRLSKQSAVAWTL